MVFTWVSTGVVEPYSPPPPIYPRVPSTHPIQRSAGSDPNSSPLDLPVDLPSPGLSASNPIHAYKESSRSVSSGDVLQYVHEIMQSEVDTLQATDSLEDAKRKFRIHRYRHIPILDSSDRLVGILSDRDILRLMADEIQFIGSVHNHMVTKVLTAAPNTRIRDAANTMVQEKIGCLPILSPRLELVGILTRSDILKAIVRNPPLQLFA